MTTLNLKTGREEISWECPIQLLKTATLAGEIRAVSASDALNCPTGSLDLKELAEDADDVAILVPDITRSWQDIPVMCTTIRKDLEETGIDKVTWVIATGQHRKMSIAEEETVLGKSRRPKDNVFCHVSRENIVDTGKTTSRGTPVKIERHVFEADLVVLLGGICYHDLAGFAGGRKIIIPGVSAKESVQANHKLGLVEKRFHEKVKVGELEENPVALDMEEYARIFLADKKSFLLNVVTDAMGRPYSYVAGDAFKAWERGVREAEALQTIWIDELADVAIVSCGGYPYDLDLYQATKALTAVYDGLRQSGGIVLVAGLEEGMGTPVFDRFMRLAMDNFDAAIDELEEDFTIPAYIATKTVYELKNRKCALVTQNKDVAFPGLITNDVKEALRHVAGTNFEGKALFVPTGNAVHVKIKEV